MPCPICQNNANERVYHIERVPVHSARLFHEAQAAQECASGILDVLVCELCGHGWNQAFDEQRLDYGESYEETQAFSNAFRGFQAKLARDLVDTLRLKGETVLEIGCGKGDFLNRLAEEGVASAVGIDPSYDTARHTPRKAISVTPSLFPHPDVTQLSPKAVVCLMTLEHIAHPRHFINTVKATYADASLAVMVPAFERIIEVRAFWDIYYEHCQYFSAASLSTLFHTAGYQVDECTPQFDGQYWLIVGSPSTSSAAITQAPPNGKGRTLGAELTERLIQLEGQLLGRNFLLWGAASKAVALLSALPSLQSHCTLVDINPNKHNSYLPGTPLVIHAPEDLANREYDAIVIANPVYQQEIRRDLARLNIKGPKQSLDFDAA